VKSFLSSSLFAPLLGISFSCLQTLPAMISYSFESGSAPASTNFVTTEWSGADGGNAPSMDMATIQGKSGASDDFVYYFDSRTEYQRFSFSPGALQSTDSMSFDQYVAVDDSVVATIQQAWADVWIYDGSTTLWLNLADTGQVHVEDTWNSFSLSFDTSTPWYTQSGSSDNSYASPSAGGSLATQMQLDAVLSNPNLEIGLGVEVFNGANGINELVAIDNIVIIPEPSTLLFAVFSLLVFAGFRRMKHPA